ncbi:MULTISPECIES: hydrogenase-2 assembly chaperone [Pasteurellaceae]|uniref:hydrogenase-2 assembly chaperone n=1 Tax=Pasteurellaceae TaxID=712 RepID=UPI0035695A41
MKTGEKDTALDLSCMGFAHNPAELFRQAMEKIVPHMHDLPFFRADIPCFCPQFVLFEGQWLGAVVTPWMLSVVILPGPDQYWENRIIGDKRLLRLPYKDLVFTVGHLEDIPQYLTCSLLSPLDKSLTPARAVGLAADCLQMMLSLPVKQQAPDLSKRNLFKALGSV